MPGKRERSTTDVVFTVETLKDIVALLPQQRMSESQAAEVVDAYRKSAMYSSDAVKDLRTELESYTRAARDGTKDVLDVCNGLQNTATKLVTAMDKEGAPATFDDVWNKATNVFGPMYTPRMRFVHYTDLFSESTEAYQDGTIVPDPLDLALDARCTKVHVFPGESGMGKTVRLTMGACCQSSATYNCTLGMYFKGSSFGECDEGALGSDTDRVEKVRKCLVDAVGTAMRGFLNEHHLRCDSTKGGIFRDRALVLCLDEFGSRGLFVRTVIAENNDISKAIIDDWGFGNVVLMIAGTGIEGTTMTPGSDPATYVLHTIPPADRELFRALCAGTPIEAVVAADAVWNRFPELDRFVQNRRLSYYLAQSLSLLPASSTKFPALGWCIRSSMLGASNKYRSANNLKYLTEEETVVMFADILCATMLGPSFHVGRSFRSTALQCCLRDAAVCRTFVVAGDVVLTIDPDGGKALVIPATAGTRSETYLVAPRRYHMTASLQMALQLLVGGGLTHAASGEEFEVHFASYAACCYLAVSRLESAMRTAATFLALLSEGSSQPLNPPLNEGERRGVAILTLPTASVAAWHTPNPNEPSSPTTPPDPTTSLSETIASHRLEQTSIQVVVLTTPLRELDAAVRDVIVQSSDQKMSVQRDLAALRKASMNAVTVVVTARGDSAADIVVVIRGLGMLPISCKKYEEGTTWALSRANVWEELWEMGAVVEKSSLPTLRQEGYTDLSEQYRMSMRNLGVTCGLEGDALRIVGFQIAFLDTETVNQDVKEVPPMSLAEHPSVEPQATVPVKYFACGSAFENTFPLQRFSPIERETFEIAVGAMPRTVQVSAC